MVVSHSPIIAKVVGVSSYNMKRFIFEGEREILSRIVDDIKPQEFTVEVDDVYNIDIMMSSGLGRLHPADIRTTGWCSAYSMQITKVFSTSVPPKFAE